MVKVGPSGKPLHAQGRVHGQKAQDGGSEGSARNIQQNGAPEGTRTRKSKEIIVVSSADISFANTPMLKSQAGYAVYIYVCVCVGLKGKSR